MENGVVSHVSLGTNNFTRATVFYDKVMAALSCRRVMEFPGATAYGKDRPEFWIQVPIDGKPAAAGNGTHIAFLAPTEEAVDAFHAAALAAGGKDEGAPGPRPQYGPAYYGCFVRDPDGHKLEAMHWKSADIEL